MVLIVSKTVVHAYHHMKEIATDENGKYIVENGKAKMIYVRHDVPITVYGDDIERARKEVESYGVFSIDKIEVIREITQLGKLINFFSRLFTGKNKINLD